MGNLKIVRPEPETSKIIEFPRSLNAHRHDYRAEHNKIIFDSRSEAACAIIMEQYISWWKVEPGITFQVPLSSNKRADFQIADVLFEYHPISLHREMISRDAYSKIKRAILKSNRFIATLIREGVEEELLRQYRKRREQVIQANPRLSGMTLVVCTSPGSFYRNIIKQFSDRKHNYKEVVTLFNAIVNGRG